MAKANFDPVPESPGQDVFNIVPSRRAGERQVHTPKYEALPGGGRKVKSWKTETIKGTQIPLSGPDRRVFSEDLSETELPRLEEAHKQFQSNMTGRAETQINKLEAKGTEDSLKQAGLYRQMQSALSNRSESFKETGDRILKSGGDWAGATRMRGESAMPGAGWYFRQNSHLRRGATGSSRAETNALITASGSMSPLNAPETESESAIEINRAHKEKSTVTITPDVAKWVRERDGIKPGDLPNEHVGAPVAINDLHHNVVSQLARKERREAFPDMQSGADFDKIAKGGTNVDKGVQGARGVPSDVLSPPTTAPKVNNYTMNTLVHEAPKSVVRDYTARMDATGGITSTSPGLPRNGAPADKAQRTVHLDTALVSHLSKQLGKGTSSYNEDDQAVRALKMNAGRTVHVDDLHPRLVEAMAHPTNKDKGSRALALTSSNMPTTQDSWVNGAVMGQPQATVVPRGYLEAKAKGESVAPPTNTTSVYKAAGSEQLGYWSSNQIHDETASKGKRGILDVSNTDKARPDGREIGKAALQHAAQDHIIRSAARRAGTATGATVPSVGVQEAQGWTVPRRVAGGDTPFNQHLRGKQFG